MDPKEKGEIAEAVALSELKKRGYTVSKPFGENCRYDFIVDDGDSLSRIQVKKGRWNNGKVVFSVESSRSNFTEMGRREDYHGDIDAFVVVHDYDIYWVPINDAPSSEMSLRIDDPGVPNPNINWASEYEI